MARQAAARQAYAQPLGPVTSTLTSAACSQPSACPAGPI